MRRISYDLVRSVRVKVTEGQRPASDRMAIQLIYQPKGLLNSFLEELQYFSEAGYNSVVVSNVPLAPADLERLKPLCHLIVERPNIGYDFGGYREGILTLRDRGLRPTHLIMKNDSIWFPIWPDCDVLDRATESKADLFGIFLNEFKGTPHLQSYFVHFGPRLLSDPRFWSYWARMGLWNAKPVVIRRCEKQLTQAFIAMGFTHDALYRPEAMVRSIEAADDDMLERLYEFHRRIYAESGGRVPELGVARGDPEWRLHVKAQLIRGMSGHMLIISHPSLAMQVLRSPILKKDRRSIYRMQREEVFRSGADRGMRPTVRQEILSWDQDMELRP